MVCFSCSTERRKQFYNCEANSLGVVWCGVAIGTPENAEYGIAE